MSLPYSFWKESFYVRSPSGALGVQATCAERSKNNFAIARLDWMRMFVFLKHPTVSPDSGDHRKLMFLSSASASSSFFDEIIAEDFLTVPAPSRNSLLMRLQSFPLYLCHRRFRRVCSWAWLLRIAFRTLDSLEVFLPALCRAALSARNFWRHLSHGQPDRLFASAGWHRVARIAGEVRFHQ